MFLKLKKKKKYENLHVMFFRKEVIIGKLHMHISKHLEESKKKRKCYNMWAVLVLVKLFQ